MSRLPLWIRRALHQPLSHLQVLVLSTNLQQTHIITLRWIASVLCRQLTYTLSLLVLDQIQMTTLNKLAPLQSLCSRIECMIILHHRGIHHLAHNLLADVYNRFQWSKKKKARPDIIFDKDSTWWAYVQPQAYPRVTGYGTTLQAALQSLLDQLSGSPQQWMMAMAEVRLQGANQAIDCISKKTTKPDLSTYTFVQGSSSNSGSSSSFTPTLPNPLPRNPTLIAPPAERGPFLQEVQQLCNSIRETIPDVTNLIQRSMSSSTTRNAPVKHHQQMPTMTLNYMGPLPSNFQTSAGLVSPTIPNGNVVTAAMTNPPVSQPFLQGHFTPSSFDQPTSHRVNQPTAPIYQAAQIKQDFSSLPPHNTSVDVPEVNQARQSDNTPGGAGQTPKAGTAEPTQKRMRVEEQPQKIKPQGQPMKTETEEQPQKIKVEERPLKKIKVEDSD